MSEVAVRFEVTVGDAKRVVEVQKDDWSDRDGVIYPAWCWTEVWWDGSVTVGARWQTFEKAVAGAVSRVQHECVRVLAANMEVPG